MFARLWNPIGVPVPDDEYDSYALQVAGKLIHQRRPADIAEYLNSTQELVFGTPANTNRNERIAAVLVQIHELLEESKQAP